MLTAQLEEQLQALLRKHVLFSLLPDDQVRRLGQRCEVASFALGELVLEEGEPGDCAYLIYAGKVRVFKQGPAGRPVTLGVLSRGDLFGERAVLTDEPRSASCRASADCVLFRIRREDFRAVLRDNPALAPYFDQLLRQRALVNFLRLATFLGSTPPEQVAALLGRLEECTFRAGDAILRQGEPGDRMYVIRSGEVRVVRGRPGEEAVLNYLGAGDYFGELALLHDEPRAASVVAVQDTTCYSLSRAGFARLLAEAPRVHEQLRQGIAQYRASQELEEKYGLKPPAVARREQPAPAPPGPASPDAEVAPAGDGAKLVGGRRYPWVGQHDGSDCGAAALAMVARWHGLRPSLARLREAAQVGPGGASLFHLATVAEGLGFDCRAVKTDFAHLDGMALPAVAHWQGYHYVVLYQAGGGGVVVGDPALGVLRLGRQEFEEGWTGTLLLLTPTPRLKAGPAAGGRWRALRPLLAPVRPALLLGILASLLAAVLHLTLPVLVQMTLDGTSGAWVVALLAVASAYAGGLAYGHRRLAALGRRLGQELPAHLLGRLLRLPLAYFESRRRADVLARFADVRRVQDLLAERAAGALADGLVVCAGLGLLLCYSMRLGLLALGAVAGLGTLALYVTPRLQHRRRQARAKEAAITAALEETATAVAALKGVGAEGPRQAACVALLADQAAVASRARRLETILAAGARAVGVLGAVAVLGYGARLVQDGELTLGALAACALLWGGLASSLQGLAGCWPEWPDGLAALDRLEGVYEAAPEQGEAAPAGPLPLLRGHVRFRDVSFRYGPAAPDALSRVTLEIMPGQVVALLGRPGAGKTTLARLAARLYLPTEGAVLLDGHDTRAVDVAALRRQVSVVGPDEPVFTGTVRANIALADPGATLDRVAEAARLARADDFIRTLPQGYDTIIGPDSLPPDQRQRLGIARALLKDPRILIWDEATALLDAEAARAIQADLPAFVRGRTALLIPHRPEDAAGADVVIVLDEGRVVERGAPGDLLQARGVYDFLTSRPADAAAPMASP